MSRESPDPSGYIPHVHRPPASARTTVKRLPARGAYDRETVHAILDEALMCHVGFIDDGHPFVIPTIHVRRDDRLYLHGSNASRMLRVLAGGAPACITVTLLDGLVLARSAFHHSMNYRSVVVLGTARRVDDPTEKWDALHALSEHVCRGRWADARQPSALEMAATTVVAFAMNEASAKIRTGPPKDDAEDYALPVWAGVLPLAMTPGAAMPDPLLSPGIALPDYVRGYRRG